MLANLGLFVKVRSRNREQFIVWKFHDFSVVQIFREINFEESRNSKLAVCAILGALVFVELVNFSLQKVQNFLKIKIQSHKCVKMADFALQEYSNLTS